MSYAAGVETAGMLLGALVGAVAGTVIGKAFDHPGIGLAFGVVAGGGAGFYGGREAGLAIDRSVAAAKSALPSGGSGSGGSSSGSSSSGGGTSHTTAANVTLQPGNQSIDVATGAMVTVNLPNMAQWAPQVAGQGGMPGGGPIPKSTPPTSGAGPWTFQAGDAGTGTLALNWKDAGGNLQTTQLTLTAA